MTSLSKRRYLDRTIQDEIEFRAMEGWTPIQIYEKLEMKHKNEKLEGTLPSLRTVQRVVKDVTVEDRSGTWNLSDCKGEDAKLILEVISELVIQTDGKVCSLTKAEAEWIVKIRKAVPDMKLYSTWAMAKQYLLQESSGSKEFQALDNYLSFTPWRSKYHNYFYSKAISEGWVEECAMVRWIDYLPYELTSGMVRVGKLGILESGISPDELAELDNITMEENHVQITELLSFFRGAIPLKQITKMIDDMERPKDLLTEEGKKKWIETFIETFTEVLPNLEVKDGLTARHMQEEYINGKMTLKECFALFLPIEKDMYTPPESYVGKELKKKRWAALSRKFPQFYKPEVKDERLSKEQG